MHPLRIISTVTAMALAGCCSPGPLTDGIPNLAQVEKGIWRGGQPTEAGWLWLQRQGVTNIVMLSSWSDAEDSIARSLGMAVQYHPIDVTDYVFGPDVHNVRGAVADIRGGTLVRCEHGQDRTGLVVACYRLSQGQPKREAEDEMLRLGFHKELAGLWEFWERQKQEDWRMK